ncbi:Nuclear cap-binding protein subunit 1 [Cyanidiococcus yangmingshanensis]|uniref:Nuclear cap-binding protein subunit 1 n=1 Tax=Cyanidiococcus yangmingshanensis TaxID=2690220 RepID=A0A7J7INW5_9RHOD|nr:Nuclear cap-binding protein subunit 1 [Cyanidiococcus yangmingshanensis]
MVENWGGVLRHLRDEQGAAAAGTMLATIVLQTWRQSHQNALLTLNALCAADILDRATAVATAFRQLMATTSSFLACAGHNVTVQALLLAVSRATERDVEHYQSQLAQAQQMLQMYRQGLKRLLVVVLDCLAQMLNRYRSETRVAGSEGDTTEASALQQWLAQRAQGPHPGASAYPSGPDTSTARHVESALGECH